MAEMRRVVAYIDGFNLYHAIDDLKQPHLKWLDLHKLCRDMLRAREHLTEVHYFSAYATWRPAAYARHREYVKALAQTGVTPCMAKFKEKPRRCSRCGATWTSHEEKETDVNIAIKIVEAALTDAFDRAILISADSDLGPALRMARRHRPDKELFIVAPPGRFGAARDLGPKLVITPGRLARALLPEAAYDAQGLPLFRRPGAYAPPT
jgi:uncharacterized LabA/DUF88 family protein